MASREVPDATAGGWPYRRSMTSAPDHHPSRREILAELQSKLKRVHAADDTLTSLTAVPGTSNVMLSDALQSLQHDLLHAAREAEAVRERISR
jgi:hypothetical protein